MIVYKHKDWQTFKGTWYIVSNKTSDEQIKAMIVANGRQYGNIEDWQKT